MKRALRTASAITLAGLALVIGLGAGTEHAAQHQVRAQDTTWAIPANVIDSDSATGIDGGAPIQPLDTTW